jgi:hypothetical protein
LQNSSGTTLLMYAGTNGPSAVGPAVGTWLVIAARYNGASSVLALNAGAPVTGNVGASTSTGAVIGAAGVVNASLCFQASMYIHLIYNAAHSDAHMLAIATQLKTMAGIA